MIYIEIMNLNKITASIKNKINFELNYPMSNFVSFKTGGNCDLFIETETTDDLIFILKLIKSEHIPYVILGRGTNILVSDNGIRGCVIRPKLENISLSGNEICAECSVLLSKLVLAAHKNNLSGFEFLGGIPGSVGGAIVMNAGAYGSEVKDFLKSVQVLTPDFQLTEKNASELDLSYRHSNIESNGEIVISASFILEEGNIEHAKTNLKNLNARRLEKQPLNYPSAGSTFKRPKNNYASALIQDCGLKGKTIGGACVSEKHAGFIINKGNATSKDIYNLINYVKENVFLQTGIELECEVKFLGDFT